MFSLQIIRISLRKPASYGLLVSIRWVGLSVMCIMIKSYAMFFFVCKKVHVCFQIIFLSDSKPRCRLLWEGRDSTMSMNVKYVDFNRFNIKIPYFGPSHTYLSHDINNFKSCFNLFTKAGGRASKKSSVPTTTLRSGRKTGK